MAARRRLHNSNVLRLGRTAGVSVIDRILVYPGEIPQDTDILSTNQDAMIALGYLIRATFGTSPVADGLVCAPTSPASLSVTISPGSLTQLTTIEGLSSYGSLSADTTNPLMKMGINKTSTTLTLTAPSTSGQSQCYLVQANFNEADTTATVLPYYDASNPSVSLSGPGNSGASQNTVRQQTVSIQLVAGTPATSGSQTIPAVTAGWSPLWVITVANGQTAITSGNIASAASAPFLNYKMPQLNLFALLSGANTFTGTGNTFNAPLTVASATANGHAVNRGQFTGTTTTYGGVTWNVRTDPDGFITQMASVQNAGGPQNYALTFPVAFQVGCQYAGATSQNNTTSANGVSVYGVSNTGLSVALNGAYSFFAEARGK